MATKRKASSHARSRPGSLAKRRSKSVRKKKSAARKPKRSSAKRKSPPFRKISTTRKATRSVHAVSREPDLLARVGAGDRLRLKVLELTQPDKAEERAALELRLGSATVARMLSTAQATRGSDRQGKVIVLHGIMGSNLDSRDSSGDWDRVWIHAWRLFKGRIRDLELSTDGKPIPGRTEVRVRGLLEDYAPLVVELERRWEVLPFAYDWRVDIDTSADQLAATIRDFAQGQPVHIVAHSMGGLVARRFAHRHPDLWRAIDDPNGHARGGRLVQLGTPNRGSFAISLFLTGQDEIVKKLALVDVFHSKAALVKKLRGFAGSYQMLPPPDGSFGDHRAKLHDATQWGVWPVVQGLIDRGRKFQDEMKDVRDPERLAYVAGYAQETPFRVRVRAPGVFEYGITKEGDGRVPHDLGLLPNVRTSYVKEAHGDLPKNGSVLDGIHDLLAKGTTAHLETSLAMRSKLRATATKWVSAAEVETVEPELKRLVAAEKRRRGVSGEPQWTAEEGERVERSLARGALGSKPAQDAPTLSVSARARVESSTRPPVPRLEVAVVHADITQVEADLYAVGHYAGVLPQNAEAAFDRVISSVGANFDERVLVRLTRRGMLDGELGQVHLFPWRGRPKRQVAVAGMGTPGGFGHAALRRVGQSLAYRALDLAGVRTLATVLIGSGEGNLPTDDAVRALFAGAADSILQHKGKTSIKRLLIVDREEIKARRILRAVTQLSEDPKFREVLQLELTPRTLKSGDGAESARKHAMKRLAWELKSADKPETDENDKQAPSRMVWTRSEGGLCVSALTSAAVVPERVQRIDLDLLDELVVRMTDAEPERARTDGELLGRLVLPRDFRAHFALSRRLIIEVDRYTAGVHWEMISLATQPEQVAEPLAMSVPVARQLRTAYAPAPARDESNEQPLRVLIVGDPGNPDEGWDLPGARAEAIAVRSAIETLARERGIPCQITALIGAPSAKRSGELAQFRPAGRLDVVDALVRGSWDLLHYCGHGDFDPRHPERVGWVFEGGLLTSSELEKMDSAPRLVVANACLSGRTSDQLASGKRSSEQRTEADLLPSLADEFFHRGVRDYIGTAWEVDDAGAVEFAKEFYGALFNGKTIGRALLAARGALYAKQDEYGSLWSAYQHYGDPDGSLRKPRVVARGRRRSKMVKSR